MTQDFSPYSIHSWQPENLQKEQRTSLEMLSQPHIERQMPLEERILEKLQAFHDTLGEDIKYLSDEEQVSPKKLFSDLSKSLDDDEESTNPELAYLAVIRQIRDNDPKLFETIKPILAYMGCNIIRMGDNGKGLVMKICHNTLTAQIQNGVNETMLLAQKMGVSPEDYHTAISYGGGQNFYLDGQWKNLADENWATAFSLQNEFKDLGICKRLSQQADFEMPGLENAMRVYQKGMDAGIGTEDWRATYKVVRGDYDA